MAAVRSFFGSRFPTGSDLLRKYSAALFGLCLALSPNQAAAWGNLGHQAIGTIAESVLTTNSKAKIKNLIGNEALAASAVWPDTIKSQVGWIHTKPYHFTDVPDNSTYLDQLRRGGPQSHAQGDIVRALVKAEDTLRSSNATSADKAFALRFLVHFEGDLHQPLHTGRPEDRGGNMIMVAWFANPSNLHAVWDFGMLGTFTERKGANHDPTNLNDLLNSIRRPSSAEILKWQSSYIQVWFDESFRVRPRAYDGDAGLSEEYYIKNANLANERVLMAGYRLGAWLNDIFAGKALSPAAINLRQSLDSILGPNGPQQIVLKERSSDLFRGFDPRAYVDPCAGHKH